MFLIKKNSILRVASHCLFWVGFLFFYVSTKPDFLSYYSYIFVYSWKVFFQAIFAYGLVYFIIPKTFNDKKYIAFGILSLSWLYFVFAILMLVKFYYLEPKFTGFFDQWPGHTMTMKERLTSFYLIFGEFTFITYPAVILGFISFSKKQQRLLKIEEEKKAIELKVLKNQLNPHFLFNTLNNLYVLSLKKDDKAPEVISKLAEILDFILYRCNDHFIDITKEIKLLENYIALEKLRYDENRLTISFSHSIEGNNKIPPLLLLTFVENAFKHSVINETKKAFIAIDLKCINNQIIFTIENSKPQNELTKAVNSSGIGIQNNRKQLELLYPETHNLLIEEDKQKFKVSLTLNV